MRFTFLFHYLGRSLGVIYSHRKLFVLVTGSPSAGDPVTPWPDPNVTRPHPVGDPAIPPGRDPVILRASIDETRLLPLIRDFEFPFLHA